jgi:hypothetical protein
MPGSAAIAFALSGIFVVSVRYRLHELSEAVGDLLNCQAWLKRC